MSRLVPNEGETLEEARARHKKEYRLRYYQENKERINQKKAEYRKAYRSNGLPDTEVDYYMRNQYGISLEDYNRLLSEQNGGCAICGTPPGGNVKQKRLHIDHDHETGEVRGLLCQHCNQALGFLNDDVDRLMAAAVYLLQVRSVLTLSNNT